MKSHFITVPMSHHASHSGYGRLLDFMPHSELPKYRRFLSLSKEDQARAFREAKRQVSWYEMRDLENEVSVNALRPQFFKHVCHYLYGENSVYHTQPSRSNLKRVFVTFHQPPRYHAQFFRTRAVLESMDGIIVVGTNQIPFFSQFVDPGKIHFVPHGVDIDFFRPLGPDVRETKKCLFVGNWLRDFETLAETARLLYRIDPGIAIDVLTLPKNRFHFRDLPNVNFESGIPEPELLSKYQSATVLLVPMQDCTANNTVLEAMACGLPVITTDIGGIRDYVDDKCARLCPAADAEALAAAVVELLGDRQARQEMSTAGRLRAETFDWRTIAAVLTEIYERSFEKSHLPGRGGQFFASYPPPSEPEPISYEAKVSVLHCPEAGTPGETIMVHLKIENVSTTTWPAHVEKAVKVAYHVHRADGTLELWDGERTNLPFDLPPGHEVQVAARVTLPETPGQYRIGIDLVQEQVAWFSKSGPKMPCFNIRVS